jgi:signal transduction histidine kinase
MNSYPGAIAQLIINLLQNATIHAFDEGIQDRKIILRTEFAGDTAIISCSDNGKGIQKELVHKIFEPFVTTKRNKGGTGLGLNITYNLVTQHLNGNIKLDTEVEQGASFIITLPRSITIAENCPLINNTI